VAILDKYFLFGKNNYSATNPCLIVFCKSERWTSIYIVSKQVTAFLESASRVYKLIWKELSLQV